ncbi:MAG: PD-(D/E)XK nuclease family transposase, partial [Bulleidia sp.]|nr:PD-(D/E)XK nuclease family transposase [Bulleidia sp.]
MVEKIKKLPLLSNSLFEALMMYDMKLTRLILKVLLGYDPGPLQTATIENALQPVMNKRGIRTDVYIVAEDGTVYDIEAQTYSVKYLDKRIVLYRSFMIVCNTKKGSGYADVPSTAAIFICTEDPV